MTEFRGLRVVSLWAVVLGVLLIIGSAHAGEEPPAVETSPEAPTTTAPASPLPEGTFYPVERLVHYPKHKANLDRVLAVDTTNLSEDWKVERSLKLAPLYMRVRDFENAVKSMHEIKEPFAFESWYYANLSVDLGKLQRFKEAEAMCQKALDLDPDYAHAKWVMASWYAGQGRREDAIKMFNSPPVPPRKNWPEYRLYNTCRASFYADLNEAQIVKESIRNVLSVPNHQSSLDFFQTDITFDKYRLEPWFIELVGETVLPAPSPAESDTPDPDTADDATSDPKAASSAE